MTLDPRSDRKAAQLRYVRHEIAELGAMYDNAVDRGFWDLADELEGEIHRRQQDELGLL